VMRYREQNAQHFRPSETAQALAPDFLPWTVANGPDGLFNPLSQMVIA
jgi:hypothetical protein